MLTYIWAIMILVSYIFAFLSDNAEAVTNAALNGAAESVNMTISLLGTMCFWSGLMEIAKKSGLTEKIAKFLSPVIHLIFPELSPKSSAFSAIVMNMIANLLGLSNAATPLGLRAMEELKKESLDKERASNSMCMFVVINTASITLIPSTVIALRIAAGSTAPFEIIIPAWISSFLALVVGIIFAKIFSKKSERKT